MDEDDSAAMQQMMGFSAFGSGDKKRPNKRQKLSPDSDGLPTKEHASAGNAIPLGIRNSSKVSVHRNNTHLTNMSTQSTPSHEQQDTFPSDIQASNSATIVPSNNDPNQVITTDNSTANSDLPNQPVSSKTPTTMSTNLTSSLPPNLPPKPPVYTSSDIRSDPNYWTTSSTTTASPYSANNPSNRGPNSRRTTNKGQSAGNGKSRGGRDYSQRNDNDDEIGYTNAQSGYTMTYRELREYAAGKSEVQEDGSVVKVYFKPIFLEDPWADLITS